MDLIQIYECFCDATRLRIIHLLAHGPLCVCRFQEILELPQTKVSQQLAYLRKHGEVPGTAPRFIDGAQRDVAVYTEADRDLFDAVWTEIGGAS